MRVNAQQVINTGTMTPKSWPPPSKSPFRRHRAERRGARQRPVLRVQAGDSWTRTWSSTCAFIPNPFYVQSLKQKPGLEPEVSDYEVQP